MSTNSRECSPDAAVKPVPSDPVAVWHGSVLTALQEAVRQLAGSLDSEATVHALRRAAKQLRALVLLAPPSLDELTLETRNKADVLRRALGHTRDAAVRRQTLDHLLRRAKTEAGPLDVEMAADPNDAESASLPEDFRRTLSDLADRWSSCDLRDIRADTLVVALTRTYRRARKRWKAAGDGESEKMHRWRRAVVDLDLQTSVFAKSSPRLAVVAKEAHKLRELLGRVHDIDALAEFLASASTEPEALEAFNTAAKQERRRLARKAREHAKRLLQHKPRTWSSEVSAQLYSATRTADAGASGKMQLQG